jgi:hypothetical protein
MTDCRFYLEELPGTRHVAIFERREGCDEMLRVIPEDSAEHALVTASRVVAWLNGDFDQQEQA